jgi:hypothetical protein
MGKGKGSNRAFNPNSKKANIDHFSHQLHVTGTGPFKSKKKYSRKFNEKTVKQVIEEELTKESSLQEQADNFPNDDGGDDE